MATDTPPPLVIPATVPIIAPPVISGGLYAPTEFTPNHINSNVPPIIRPCFKSPKISPVTVPANNGFLICN